MRILLVMGSSDSGIVSHVRDLTTQYCAAGHTVGVIAPAAELAEMNLRLTPTLKQSVCELGQKPRPQDFLAVRRLRHLIKTFKADVVHSYELHPAGLVLTALRALPGSQHPRTLTTWHSHILASGSATRLQRVAGSRVARDSDAVLAVSPDLLEIARGFGAKQAHRAWISAPARTAPEDFNAELYRSALRSELGLARDAELMLAVGHLSPVKDYPTLLDAAALWSRSHPHIYAVVVGSGDADLTLRLRRRIAAEDLPVRFLGLRTDVAALQISARAVVVTSRWEGCPQSVQEAMHYGAAIVATGCGGIPELTGGAALLVPAEDPQAIADAVIKVVDEEGFRTGLRVQAAARAAEFPTPEQVAQANLDIYVRTAQA